MTTRRDVLRMSAMAAGWMIRFPKLAVAGEMGRMNYGVQLYEVRRQAQKDFAGILKAIHAIGFTQIELYPIVYDRPAAEVKQIVADAGLGLVSAHFDYAGLDSKIEYARQLGLKYMVCPMLPKDHWVSLAGFAKAAADFNRWGAAARDAGMEFLFHNHCYEFKPQEGSTGWAVLMDKTDPRLVKLEFDMFWLTQAGQDPLTMMAKYAERLRLIHLKDRVAGAAVGYDMEPATKALIELGKGSIDWPKIIEQAKRQGIRYAYLDQDETAGPVVESMTMSFSYLKSLHL